MRLPEDKLMLRDSAREFLAEALPLDEVKRLDEAGEFPMALYRQLGEMGWLGLPFSEELGGSEGDALDEAIILEQCGRAMGPLASVVLISAMTCGKTVRDVGTPEQLRRFIPGICDGSIMISYALTEPQSGSDAAAMSTRAVKVAGGWILKGQKVFCTGATIATHLLVYARTDDRPLAERGDITTFLVPTDAAGVAITPIPKLGLHPIPSCILYFDEVFVPDDDVLGEPGHAWRHVMSTLNRERLAISGMCTGMAQAALDFARGYAAERQQFGVTIDSFEAVQQHLAEMTIQVERARAMMLSSAALEVLGTGSGRVASIAKVTATDAAVGAARLGMQVLGGYGYTNDYPLQRFLRDSLIHPIAGGSNEIQRNVISDELVRNGLAEPVQRPIGDPLQQAAVAVLREVDSLLQSAVDHMVGLGKDRENRWAGQALKHEIANILILRDTADEHIGSAAEQPGSRYSILALIEAADAAQLMFALARRLAGEKHDTDAIARVAAARATVDEILDSTGSGSRLRTLLFEADAA